MDFHTEFTSEFVVAVRSRAEPPQAARLAETASLHLQNDRLKPPAANHCSLGSDVENREVIFN